MSPRFVVRLAAIRSGGTIALAEATGFEVLSAFFYQTALTGSCRHSVVCPSMFDEC